MVGDQDPAVVQTLTWYRPDQTMTSTGKGAESTCAVPANGRRDGLKSRPRQRVRAPSRQDVYWSSTSVRQHPYFDQYGI